MLEKTVCNVSILRSPNNVRQHNTMKQPRNHSTREPRTVYIPSSTTTASAATAVPVQPSASAEPEASTAPQPQGKKSKARRGGGVSEWRPTPSAAPTPSNIQGADPNETPVQVVSVAVVAQAPKEHIPSTSTPLATREPVHVASRAPVTKPALAQTLQTDLTYLSKRYPESYKLKEVRYSSLTPLASVLTCCCMCRLLVGHPRSRLCLHRPILSGLHILAFARWLCAFCFLLRILTPTSRCTWRTFLFLSPSSSLSTQQPSAL